MNIPCEEYLKKTPKSIRKIIPIMKADEYTGGILIMSH
jgi:hypothetical protein